MPEKTDPQEHVLSVVLDPEHAVLNVHADRDGLALLRAILDRLIRDLDKGECPHEHLMTPEWGCWDLSSSMLKSESERGCRTVHQINIFGWDAEWTKSHGLSRNAL